MPFGAFSIAIIAWEIGLSNIYLVIGSRWSVVGSHSTLLAHSDVICRDALASNAPRLPTTDYRLLNTVSVNPRQKKRPLTRSFFFVLISIQKAAR